MSILGTVFACFTVSVLWGATNPFIKNSTSNITKVKADSYIKQFLYEVKYIFLNWRYILPFLINQSGSVVFFFALQNAPLSLVVPLTNALTFVVTGVVGFILGEEKPDARTIFGILFILSGITVCVVDKVT